jgi:hypothetical protein
MSCTSTRRILKAIEIRPITLVVASGPTLSAPRRSKRNQKHQTPGQPRNLSSAQPRSGSADRKSGGSEVGYRRNRRLVR